MHSNNIATDLVGNTNRDISSCNITSPKRQDRLLRPGASKW